MADGISVFRQELASDAVGLIFAVALFVLDYAALEIEFFLVQDWKQMSHAVAFREKHIVQHGCGNVFKIIGAVAVGGAIQVGGADTFHGIDIGVVEIFAAAEHEVFEEVGEAGFAGLFIFRTDVIPGVYSNDGRFVVLVNHDREAVGQHKLGVRNIWNDDLGAG